MTATKCSDSDDLPVSATQDGWLGHQVEKRKTDEG